MAKFIATIPVGSVFSNAVDLTEKVAGYSKDEAYALTHIDCPAELPAITALGIQYSDDATLWRDLKDEWGVAVAVPVSALAAAGVRPSVACNLPRYIRLKSNAAATGANRVFGLNLRKV